MDKAKILLFVLLLALLAFVRPINHDESYYSISANEILNGEKPYTDFLFHQMPLMLIVYSIVSFHGFWSLIAGRLLSYVLYLAALYLIQKYLINLKPGKLLLFAVLFLFNLFLLNWIFIIKIYALTILLLIGGCIFLKKFIDEKEQSKSTAYIFISGLLFSLLFLSRVVFASNLVLLIIFFLYVLFKNKIQHKLKLTAVLFSGILLPAAVFIFIFRNNLYDIYLNTVYLNNIMRLDQVENFIKSFSAYQYIILIPQNFLMILIVIAGRKKFELIEIFYILNIIVFYIVHLFTQMYIEYLIPVLPLLIILAYNRYDLFEERFAVYLKLKRNIFQIAFLILFIVLSPPGVSHLKHYFEGREIMMTPISLYRISNDVNGIEGRTILSSWEGYSFYSSKQSVVKNEYVGSFFIGLKDRINPVAASKITFPGNYRSIIINKIPDIIVYDEKDPKYLNNMFADIIQNYSEVKNIYSFKIYKRK